MLMYNGQNGRHCDASARKRNQLSLIQFLLRVVSKKSISSFKWMSLSVVVLDCKLHNLLEAQYFILST